MIYRKLGDSDVTISVVTFGSWAIGGFMWGGADDDEAIAAIRQSIDLGVTSIDTAPVYGLGHSEEIVGKAVAGRRDKVQILTKFGLRWDGVGTVRFSTPDVDGHMVTLAHDASAKRIIEECEDSLRRLGTDYIDLYQQHWPDPDTPVQESMQALETLLKQGKILAAGVSNFPLELLQQARRVTPIVSDQPPYSMLERSIEKDVLPWCRQNNIAVIAYSPLGRGLLTGKVTLDRVFPETDHRHKHPWFSPANRIRVLDLLNKIRPIARTHNATLAQVVVNWTVHRPGITAALVGAHNHNQARENAGALDFTLSDDQMATIDRLVEDFHLES